MVFLSHGSFFWLFIIFLIKKIYFSPTKTVVNTAYLIPLFWLVAPIAIFWIIVQYTKYGGESLGYMAMGLFILLPIYLSLIFGTVAVRYFLEKYQANLTTQNHLFFLLHLQSSFYQSFFFPIIRSHKRLDRRRRFLRTHTHYLSMAHRVSVYGFFINISYKVFKNRTAPIVARDHDAAHCAYVFFLTIISDYYQSFLKYTWQQLEK